MHVLKAFEAGPAPEADDIGRQGNHGLEDPCGLHLCDDPHLRPRGLRAYLDMQDKVRVSERLYGWLGSGIVFRTLLVLNAFVVFGVIWASRNTMLSDGWSYLRLAEGILHGRYSMWWQLGPGYPDTFRTPGYPLLIAAFLKLTGSWKPVLVLQFLLYAASVQLSLFTVDRLGGGRAGRSLFLLLLLPMVNIPFYIAQLYTEIPVLAAIALAVYLMVCFPVWTWRVAVAIGLLLGFAFQCRPAFLLIPFVLVGTAWLVDRKPGLVRSQLLMLLVFCITVVPFGIWTKVNHGIFKVTPLEGAGSYMHLGYWSGKTPGYTDTYYLRNFNGDELLRFTPRDSVASNIRAYGKEWEGIKAQLDPLLTAQDSAMMALPTYKTHQQRTYNTKYTLLREQLLTRLALKHYWDDPWYTLKFKAYSAVRLWVVGIQVEEFRDASLGGKLGMLYATSSTGLELLLFIVLVPLAYARKVLSFRTTWPFLLFLAYCTIIHLPFTIQSRYTVPVRMLMIILMVMAVMGLWGRTTGAAIQKKG